jgi:hypothetical protein
MIARIKALLPAVCLPSAWSEISASIRRIETAEHIRNRRYGRVRAIANLSV